MADTDINAKYVKESLPKNGLKQKEAKRKQKRDKANIERQKKARLHKKECGRTETDKSISPEHISTREFTVGNFPQQETLSVKFAGAKQRNITIIWDIKERTG